MTKVAGKEVEMDACYNDDDDGRRRRRRRLIFNPLRLRLIEES